MANKKDSAYSLHGCGGGAHGGDAGYDPIVETQHAFKGSPPTSGAWHLQGAAGSKAAAFSCSAAVVAQRALLASNRRRAGGRRMGAASGTKSTVPSRLSKVCAAEDVAR